MTPKRTHIPTYPSIDEAEETQQYLPKAQEVRKTKNVSKSTTYKPPITKNKIYEKTIREFAEAQQRLNQQSHSHDRKLFMTAKLLNDNFLKVYNSNEPRQLELDLSKTFPRQPSDQATTTSSHRNQPTTHTTNQPSHLSPNQHSDRDNKLKSKLKNNPPPNSFLTKNFRKTQPLPTPSYQKIMKPRLNMKQIETQRMEQTELKSVRQLLKLKEDTKALYKAFERNSPDNMLLNKQLDMKLDHLYNKLVEKIKQDIKAQLN